MNVLETKKLTKRFGDFTAVDAVSFSLKKGEILGFLGQNGAGKTTTIQMLLGVLTPTSGSISYFGKDLLTQRENILEQVNFSSTYTNLPWWLTIQENLTFISYLYDISNRKERVNEVISLFKLEDIAHQTIASLSAGQLTRANLAKAFINFPKILLLDEPTASLDVEIAQYIREFLLEQRKRFNTSIVITSHNMVEVETLCDRVVVINDGKIVANDSPDNLSKSITMSHVSLYFTRNLQKIIAFCKENHMHYSLGSKWITIDVPTEAISSFLQEIGKQEISYDEISIENPHWKISFYKKLKKNNYEAL